MRTAVIMLALVGLAASGAPADEPAKKDDKKTVREIDLKGLKRELPGQFGKPAVITSAEELAKAFPEKDIQARIAKDVDFQKEQLLFFAWSGSGGDKLTYKVEDGKKGPEVVFQRAAGFTDDLASHFRLFAVPRGAAWRIDGK